MNKMVKKLFLALFGRPEKTLYDRKKEKKAGIVHLPTKCFLVFGDYGEIGVPAVRKF